MIEVLQRLGYYPRFCVWELTLACDMRCLHCGSFAGKPRDSELTPEEAQRVARELAEMRCERLTLGGGEPTLRPDWHLIGEALVRGGVRVNIISNGWSWSPDHTRKAIDAGLQNAAFSLDGPEHVHDAVRKKGSFARVRCAIDDCVRQGLPTAVVTHVNALNRHLLPDMREMLRQAGVRSWQIQIGNPAGTMGQHTELVIEDSDLLWLVPIIAELKQLPGFPLIYPSDNVGYYGKYERVLRDRGARICFWIGCRAGCQVIGIESNGNVKGCLSLPSSRHATDEFMEGNLRDHSLREIWERPGAFAFNRNYDLKQLQGFCATCRLKDICRGGCSWSAFTRTGSRFDNPLCFYRQAVLARRWDLIPDAELDQEPRETGEPVDDPVPMG